MAIADSINKARQKGITDEQILQEIIKQNPEKGKAFQDEKIKGTPSKAILDKLVNQETEENSKIEEQKRIEQARKRIAELAKLSTQEPVKEEPKPIPVAPKPVPVVSKTFIPPPQPLIKPEMPLPEKPSSKEKLLLRLAFAALILVFLAAMATFWYWYLVIRVQPPKISCISSNDCQEGYFCKEQNCIAVSSSVKCNSSADCKVEQICNEQGSCEEKPPTTDILIPESIFQTEDIRVLSIASSSEIKSVLQPVIGEYLGQDQYRRIAFKNTTENKAVGMKEFFDAMLIRVPDGFYDKIADDFTLFVYSQTGGNRLGFVARVKDQQGLNNLLKARELQLENDYQSFFELMGKQGAGISRAFRSSSGLSGYFGPIFRFQAFTTQDLGICYIISPDYFAFASSIASIKSTIARLSIGAIAVELTQDLRLGSKGDQVILLQTWLKNDPVVYKQGKVTGYYGALTKEAVKLFQEKYAADILAPQALVYGTGVVDMFTRVKLNELYSTSGIIPPNREITIDLRYGDHGNEVKLLQTWLKDEGGTIYPERIISGWFGPLTRAAVIRFQEKYSQEVLIPQGLTRGSGVVDALTRNKLNNLHGQ